MDTKVQGWFDRGQVAEAVIGDGQFFIRESAFVIHDRIFILRQLHQWSATEERAATAPAGVDAAVTRLLETARPDEAIDVLSCVAILAEDGITIPLDSARVTRWLGEAEEMYAEHAGRRAKALERLGAFSPDHPRVDLDRGPSALREVTRAHTPLERIRPGGPANGRSRPGL